MSKFFNKKVFKIGFYCLFCFSFLAIGTLFGWLKKSDVLSTLSSQVFRKTAPQEIFQNQDSLTVLFLGCDEDRAPGGKKILVEKARSDMMIVAKFDFKNKQITGVSIPRDLKISIPGYRDQKINAYHKFGGNDLAKQAAESVVHHSINKVISLNIEGIQELVDLIGGVDIDVPKRFKYTDRRGNLYINLQPGMQKLNGYNAMCFLRYRRDNEFLRQKRQREFLVAYRDTLIKNPSMIPNVVDKVKDVVAADFSVPEFAALALFATRVKTENIRMGMIPTVIAGHFYLRLKEDELYKTLREFNFIENDSNATYHVKNS